MIEQNLSKGGFKVYAEEVGYGLMMVDHSRRHGRSPEEVRTEFVTRFLAFPFYGKPKEYGEWLTSTGVSKEEARKILDFMGDKLILTMDSGSRKPKEKERVRRLGSAAACYEVFGNRKKHRGPDG